MMTDGASYQLIDSHCHIHDSDYDFIIEKVLEQSRQAGLVGLICVGTSVITSRQAVELGRSESICHPSIGIHPHLAEKHSLTDLKLQVGQLRKIADQFRSQIVAVGECGLDYHYHRDQLIRRRQRLLLEMQLELAADLQLPLIFHVRSAFADFLANL